jgi:hypothetical protein
MSASQLLTALFNAGIVIAYRHRLSDASQPPTLT